MLRSRYRRRLIPILLLVAFAIWIDLPDSPGLHLGPIQLDARVVQGLDLQGGLRVLLEADLPENVEVTGEQIQTARDIIENRVNGLGVTEPVVQVAGSRRILVELPGIENPEQAIATIRETGLLEFVDMSPISPPQAVALVGSTIRTDLGGGTSPPEGAGAEGLPVFRTVITGAALRTASAYRDPVTGEYGVQFELTEEGAQTFAEYTSAHVGDVLAIVLDKRVISAPVIRDPITNGQGTISGDFTLEEANSLAVQLRYGALPVPLKVVEIKTVGPTLGQDSLRKSAIAGTVGMSVVMAFMALYYRLPGLLADLALMAYALMTFALFKLIPVTLTLPAIAGFVLSIGVAVDANILIFERMREELRAGRTLTQAIDLGFSRAWPSIRDSNLSTLITCAILFWFGSAFGASIVKGFALTLALGVGVSLFTAITVTRSLLHLALDTLPMARQPRWLGV